jgi:hypothetical protein
MLAAVFLWPASLVPQMPSIGRLVISSEPTGAMVTINGKQQNQPTNATFVVSAGTYKVSVASLDGKLKCGTITLTVPVGQAVTRNCTAAGWQVQ